MVPPLLSAQPVRRPLCRLAHCGPHTFAAGMLSPLLTSGLSDSSSRSAQPTDGAAHDWALSIKLEEGLEECSCPTVDIFVSVAFC